MKLRRLTTFLLLFMLTVNMGTGFAYSGVQKVSNEYIEIATNDTGRFTIGTTGGSRENLLDDYKKLLYGHPTPNTSYTTIRVDGFDYYFAGNIQNPSINDQYKTNIAEGNFSNIKVKQILSIVKNNTTQLKDTVEIKYIITNTDEVTKNVGTRIMMDTMLGNNDSAPFRLPGIGEVISEKEFLGDNIPPYWQAFDDLNNPSIIAHGSLLNVPIKPDKVQFTNWNRTYSSPWNFYILPGASNGDSAVNIYWNEKPFLPGETREYVTYYGLSNFVSEQTPPVSVSLAGPSEINFDGENYLPNPITITGYFKNISNVQANDLHLDILLPNGVNLVAENNNQIIGDLVPSEERMVAWDFQIEDVGDLKQFDIELILTGSNIEEKRVVKTIHINDISNPVLETIQLVPNEISILKGQKKNLSVLGYYSDQSMKDLTTSRTGTVYSVSNEEVITVTKEGVIEATEDSLGGMVTLTASNGEITTTAIVKVEDNIETLPSEITVLPEEVTLEKGQSYQIEVFAYYENGTRENITSHANTKYSSVNESIVKVNNSGKISTVGTMPGETKVKIDYKGKTKEILVKVIGDPVITDIEFTPDSIRIEQGKSLQLTATTVFSNGARYDVTSDESTIYKTYDTKRASISPQGLLTIPSSAPLGEVGIKVTHGSKSKLITVTIISGPKPDRIESNPQMIELERGKSSQLSAILYMTNGESKDITANEGTVYKSYDLNRVIVNQEGLIQVPMNAPLGETAIRLTNSGKSQNVMVKVKSGPSPDKVEVTPNVIELERGATSQLSAELIMTDGERKDITSDSNTVYKSYDLNRATITSGGQIQIPNNAPIGETGIRVTNSGKYQLVTIKVISGPTVSELEITPDKIEIKRGESSQVAVSSILSNGERRDVTSDLGTIYKSYDTNRVTINSQGIIQVPINAPLGETGIRVTHGGKSKTVTVIVSSGPTVSSLEVSPQKSEINKGAFLQLDAISVWNNGERKSVTSGEGTNYKSYDINRATVNNEGLITIPQNAPLGEVGIRVEYGGKYKLVTLVIK
ncbi:MAG: hypothetical protein ABS934_04360 [Psychrobacillus sp.]